MTETSDYTGKRWRISPNALIQIELAWLLLAGVIGWLLADLPTGNWLATAYRKLAGGNVLGLFVLGNALGYLLYEEVNMVLSRIHNDEVIAKAVAKAVAAVRAEEVPQAIAAAVEETKAAMAATQADAVAAAVDQARAEMAAAAAVADLPQVVAETVAQERRAVAVWYARLKQAQQAGLPFDEPPPGYANGAAGSGSTPG